MISNTRACLGAVVALLVLIRPAVADVGWSEDQYTRLYGQGQRGYAKVNERGYPLGGNHLVVEFSPDNTHSIGELWVLGVVRDNVPEKVIKAGDQALAGPVVETVQFTAKSTIPAEIHEAVIDDVVVRVDVRNQLVNRIAFCGKKPSCGLWQRIFGPPCEARATCAVLERAIGIDRQMDEMHKLAEQAVERMHNRH